MASQAQEILNNPICIYCKEQTASHICKCTDTPALFCMDCLGQHHSKSLLDVHQIMPIAMLSQNPERYMRKKETLDRAVTELKKNHDRVKQFRREFTEMMQNSITYLTEYSTCVLQHLQTEEEELTLAIETAIQEASDYLDQGVRPVSSLGQAVWALSPEKLQVFEYTVSYPDLYTPYQTCVHYQNNLKSLSQRFTSTTEGALSLSQVPRDLFPAISGTNMMLYDFNTQQTSQQTLLVFVWSGYVQVDRATVLIVGREVLTLDLLTLQVTPMAPLNTPRDWVGVAQVGRTVFAFGGNVKVDGDPLAVCEKSSFPPTNWTPLPHMNYARWFFTPCPFEELLFLTSTYFTHHRAVESFSPHTETFTILPVSLPAELQLDCASVAFVSGGELLVLTEKRQMARWKIGTKQSFRVSATDRGCWSHHPPLIVGAEVYIAKGWKVEKWSLETDRFV